jgi:hypothetical protein
MNFKLHNKHPMHPVQKAGHILSGRQWIRALPCSALNRATGAALVRSHWAKSQPEPACPPCQTATEHQQLAQVLTLMPVQMQSCTYS